MCLIGWYGRLSQSCKKLSCVCILSASSASLASTSAGNNLFFPCAQSRGQDARWFFPVLLRPLQHSAVSACLCHRGILATCSYLHPRGRLPFLVSLCQIHGGKMGILVVLVQPSLRQPLSPRPHNWVFLSIPILFPMYLQLVLSKNFLIFAFIFPLRILTIVLGIRGFPTSSLRQRGFASTAP